MSRDTASWPSCVAHAHPGDDTWCVGEQRASGADRQGNDGGSIAKRDDLVRTKGGGEKHDQDALRSIAWTLCRLSKTPLRAPVLADPLGQMYNKDGILEFLLRKNTKIAGEEELRVAGHVRGLKVRVAMAKVLWLTRQDLRELRLSENAATADETAEFPFACPLTQRPMNGRHAFVYLRPCGCVFSESGLRNVCAPGNKGKTDVPESEQACPTCSTPFRYAELDVAADDVDADVVWINPPADVQQTRRGRLGAQRKRAAAKRKQERSEDTERPKRADGAAAERSDGDAAKRARTACAADTRPALNTNAPGALAAQQVRESQTNASRNLARDERRPAAT